MKPKIEEAPGFSIPNRNPVIYVQRFQSFMVVWTHFEINFFSHSRKLTWIPKNVTKRVENETHLHLHTRLEASKRRYCMCYLSFKFPSIPKSKYSTTSYVLQQGEDALIGTSLHNSHISSRVVGSPAWDASLDLRQRRREDFWDLQCFFTKKTNMENTRDFPILHTEKWFHLFC